MEWYYSNDKNEVVGPLSETTLAELRACGSINAKTWVGAQGAEKWSPYEQAFPDKLANPKEPSVAKEGDSKAQHLPKKIKWYYSNDKNEVIGPLSETELSELRTCGSIGTQTWVCAQGTEKWLPYGQAFPDKLATSPALSSMPGKKFDCRAPIVVTILQKIKTIPPYLIIVALMILAAIIAVNNRKPASSSEDKNRAPSASNHTPAAQQNYSHACRRCRGSGRLVGQCNQCYGAGTIRTSGTARYGGDLQIQREPMQVPCPKCRGGGQMAVACTHCRGRGQSGY